MSKRKHRQLQRKKLRQQYKNSDVTQDTIRAGRRLYGSGAVSGSEHKSSDLDTDVNGDEFFDITNNGWWAYLNHMDDY